MHAADADDRDVHFVPRNEAQIVRLEPRRDHSPRPFARGEVEAEVVRVHHPRDLGHRQVDRAPGGDDHGVGNRRLVVERDGRKPC